MVVLGEALQAPGCSEVRGGDFQNNAVEIPLDLFLGDLGSGRQKNDASNAYRREVILQYRAFLNVLAVFLPRACWRSMSFHVFCPANSVPTFPESLTSSPSANANLIQFGD